MKEVSVSCVPTDDAFWHHLTSVACYQLVHSVLKTGSALAERVGQGKVGCTPLGDSAWQLLQLAVAPGGPFVCFLAQMGKNAINW